MARWNIGEGVGRLLDQLESRWSLWTLIQGTGLMASVGIPAWAVNAADLFVEWQPLSSVIAGALGALTWVTCRVLWNLGATLKNRASLDRRLMEGGSLINPLDLTFERKRILINDLVLPSHPFIDGKTFIECDLVGPANIYFHSSNMAQPIKPPQLDAVWLGPETKFLNGFVFTNCIFRNCSFQRITMYAGLENYENWKDNPNVNWISVTPSPEQIEARKRFLEQTTANPSVPLKLEAPKAQKEEHTA